MSTTELRRRIKKTVDGLPPDQLMSAAAFVGYLADQVGDKQAEKLIKVARMKARLETADLEFAQGKGVGDDDVGAERDISWVTGRGRVEFCPGR